MSNEIDQEAMINEAVGKAIKSYFNTTNYKKIEKKVHQAINDEVDYICGEGLTENMGETIYQEIFELFGESLKRTFKGGLK